MAHIDLGVDETRFPGINGPMRFRPETAKPLNELAEALLRGPSPLTRGERELIAAYVSGLNECRFCCASHSAFAAAQLDGGMHLVDQVHADVDAAPVSAKLRALLRIAGAVREDGRKVTAAMVDAARAEGATDVEIHDTVLIAAAFCMYNRYVDGLGTRPPENPQRYAESARRIVEVGYVG
ncbi:MAG TPA: peroxidase-related enzyme [Micromonosporaceae bacterium]|nr:peroxidase-related enzyme [Micromonosporaceae bacterium]